MAKGDFCYVLEVSGDWARVQNIWSGKPAWVMHQNQKGKKIAEPWTKDPAEALKAWTKVMEVLVAGGVDLEKEAAAKAEADAFKARVEAEANARKKEKAESAGDAKAKALGMENFKMSVQMPLAGGVFWAVIAPLKVRDERSTSGEVVGDLSKGDVCHVLAQSENWCRLQNIWDGKPEAWVMVENKKTGRKMAEVAPDQAAALQKWTDKMDAMVNTGVSCGFPVCLAF